MAIPKVSVVIITFNHEAYIAQAVESVLMQQTDFEFELLVSEDCSTDGTRAVLQEVQDRWPGGITLLLSERNQFDNEVLTRGFAASRGEYIALLEGDDYWTSPKKLQVQVDYLDGHPECASCFHDVTAVYESGVQKEAADAYEPGEASSVRDLLDQGCFIETATLMFRREALPDFPDWFRDVVSSDWVLNIFIAEHGSIGYIREAMAAHRYHEGGVWTRMDSAGRLEKIVEAGLGLQKHLKGENAQVLRALLAEKFYQLAVEREKAGETEKAREAARQGLNQIRLHPKLMMFVYTPWLWRRVKAVIGTSE